jgi:hypothetical protein
MIVTNANVERFFAGYVDAFNRSLGDHVDTDAIMAHFSPCFVAAGPQGVKCGENDQTFADVLQQGYGFYRSIGLQQMAMRAVATTPIDNDHQMARVSYRASYKKVNGELIDLDFEVTYMLAARGDTFEIFAFVAGDEMALYRKHGLVPDST